MAGARPFVSLLFVILTHLSVVAPGTISLRTSDARDSIHRADFAALSVSVPHASRRGPSFNAVRYVIQRLDKAEKEKLINCDKNLNSDETSPSERVIRRVIKKKQAKQSKCGLEHRGLQPFLSPHSTKRRPVFPKPPTCKRENRWER
jgi:hypothetical protein